ncbi:MAG: FG-GAP-like repeat-containing protein, partial [Candidatus Latescibacteria bacterium]|nr:FG-GAP-like repeat-containing protein [Candidatus Latescibacterota bacterium]
MQNVDCRLEKRLEPFAGVLAAAIALSVALIGGQAWGMGSQLPHLEAERQKNLGVAYLEQEQPKEAAEAFRQVMALVPDEALGSANLGLAYLRLGQADSAAVWLDRARGLEPDNPDVVMLVAEVQQWTGDWAAATATFQQALALRPKDRVARYAVYRAAVAQQGDPKALTTARRELAALFDRLPRNVAIAAKVARSRADEGDFQGAEAAVRELRESASDGDLARKVMGEAEQALARRDTARARRQLTILENVLRPTPRYKQSLGELQSPVVGMPLTRFSDAFYGSLRLERPPAVPVRFVPMGADDLPGTEGIELDPSTAAGSLDVADVDGDGRDDLLIAVTDGRKGDLRLWTRRGAGWHSEISDEATGSASSSRFVDFDNDASLDAVSAGPGGLRLLRGDSTGTWHDVSTTAGLSDEPCTALELIDSDNEGDLDFCASAAGGLRLYENRLDGTFRLAGDRAGLAGVSKGVRQILALDHDDDLDMDLLVIDGGGRTRLFDNLRQGRFAETEKGVDTSACRQVVAADLDNDGWSDLVLVGEDGTLRQQTNGGGRYAAAVDVPIGVSVRKVTALDVDNDGWMDLAVAGDEGGSWEAVVLRNAGDGSWERRAVGGLTDGCLDLMGADLDGDGDLEFIALDRTGKVLGWRNEGGNANHWMRVRLQGLRTAGTKNNLHGIGAKVEIKAGLHYQL